MRPPFLSLIKDDFGSAASLGIFRESVSSLYESERRTWLQPPTIQDVEREILDAIATYKVRAGETVPGTAIQMKLETRGIRANEFFNALQSMVDKKWIEPTSVFIKLTDRASQRCETRGRRLVATNRRPWSS
jgi:hypothetical protein